MTDPSPGVQLSGLSVFQPSATDARTWTVPSTHWRQLLSEEETAEVNAICPPRLYRKGERVYRMDDPAEALFILLEGHIKLTRSSTPGHERIVALCGPDDFFGESFLTGGARQPAEAVCVSERAVICAISGADFLVIARRVPNVALLLARVLARRTHDLQLRLEQSGLPVPLRLARALAFLAEHYGRPLDSGVVELRLNLRQDELASLIGAGRATTTQILSTWRARGLLSGTRGTYQLDLGRLGALIRQLEDERLG